MSVVDYLLNSLVKRLQKTQKSRLKRKKRAKKEAARAKKKKASRKTKKTAIRRKSSRRKKRPAGRSAKRVFQKSVKTRKKKTARKTAAKPKRKPKKSVRKKARVPRKVPAKPAGPDGERIGEVTHYFSKIGVIVLKMTAGKLLVGESIHIHGRKTDFTQKVKSLQIESVDVRAAKKGQLVGLKVVKKAKPGDRVYKKA